MQPQDLFNHYRAQSARIPRDKPNSLPGMPIIRRTITGDFVAGEVTKAGTPEFGRFRVRDFDTGVEDWISYQVFEAGEAFLTHSRGDAFAIVSVLKRAAKEAAGV
jgi:hypothetical protein